MGRLRGGWALMMLLGLAGCAGGGVRRAADLPPGAVPTSASASTPNPTRRPWGGLFARRMRPPRPTTTAVGPTVARYFPGLARPTAALTPAPAPEGLAARGAASPAPAGRQGADAVEAADAPFLPVVMRVEVSPSGSDPATTRLASHEEPIDPGAGPPPLVEAEPAADRDRDRDRGFRGNPVAEGGPAPSSGPSPADSKASRRAPVTRRRGRSAGEPGPDPEEVAGAPAGPPELLEASPARHPAMRSREVRPVAYVSQPVGPAAMLPPVLFPRSYYEADPAAPGAAAAGGRAIPPAAKRAWRPWADWPGLARREPGDVAQGG